MHKGFVSAVPLSLLLVLLPWGANADRTYTPCDEEESTLCTGLVALYEFEEDADSLRTSETGSAPFEEIETLDTQRSSTHKTGDYALQTVATAYFLRIPETEGPSGEFTMAFWLRLDSSPTLPASLVTMLNTNNVTGYPRLELVSSTGTKVRFTVRQSLTNAETSVTDTTSLTTGTWYHIVFGVYANPVSAALGQHTIWIQVNNNTRTTANTTYPPYGTLGDLYLGYGVTGQIDQLGAWAGSLMLDEVAELYNSGSGKEYPFVN